MNARNEENERFIFLSARSAAFSPSGQKPADGAAAREPTA